LLYDAELFPAIGDFSAVPCPLWPPWDRALGLMVNIDCRAKPQEKGHRGEPQAFHQAITGARGRRIPWGEAVEVTRTPPEVDPQVWSQ
jgi:hypothetical protein